MPPEQEQSERSSDRGKPAPKIGHTAAGRKIVAEGAARSLMDEDPYETAQEFAERHGKPFMTFDQAKSRRLIVQNDRGNFEPAPGYHWVDNPAKREKHLRNWAVRKLEVDPRERAREKRLPFMTHGEAVKKGLLVKNRSDNWEPAEGYEWVDYPKLSGNWAVRKKRPAEPVPQPKPTPPQPPKAPVLPTRLATSAASKFGPKPKPKPGPKPGPEPLPAPHTHASTGPLPPPIPEPDIALEDRLLDLRDILENLNGDLEELDNLQGYIYTSFESGGRYRIIFSDDNHVEIGFEDPIRGENWIAGERPIELSDKDGITDALLLLDDTLYLIPARQTETAQPVAPTPTTTPSVTTSAPEHIRSYNDQYRERAKIGIRIFLRGYHSTAKEGVENWTNAIVHEIESQGLPLTPQIVTLVLTVISRESGFQTEPRIGNMLAMYNRLKQKVRTEHGILFRAAQFLLEDAEAKYKPKLAAVKTEKDLEELAAEALKDPLMESVQKIPFYGDEIYAKVHDELQGVVGTVGSMQVNVKKALEIAKREGKTLTEREIRDELYTLQGGLHYGIAMLAEAVRAYDRENTGFDMTEAQVRSVLTDYNGGLYTCRNAAIQAQLGELTGTTLVPDGDLLAYDKDGKPHDHPSATEIIFRKFVENYNLGISDAEIRRQLLQEKSIGFTATTLYEAVKHEYQKKFPSGDLTSTVTPQTRTSHLRGEIKFGVNLSTATYSSTRVKAYRENLRRIERFYT